MKNALLGLTVFLATGILFAKSNPTASEIIANVQKKYNQTNDAIIYFTQTVVYPLSKISRTVHGTLFIKKENHYKIVTDEKTIVTDGKTSWIYSPETNQVIIDNFREDENTITPDRFLLNVPSNYFAVLLTTSKDTTGEIYILRLTPKNDNSFIRSIKIWVNSDWTVRRAEVSDINDVRYDYSVEKIRLNTNLSYSEFKFTPPKGVQIVDLRNH
ncbi:MAG: outer membrane lipoprotein chaperone LolA [Candidatus Kryptoniota bacterium]